jgi:hypothetical protein
MVNKVLTLRSTVTGNRPPAGHLPGELYVNLADNQLGIVNTSSANQDLLAVRYFSTTANYAVGDFVLQGGNLYRATTASAPGAFNAANWSMVATAATLSAGYLPLTGGTLTGPLQVGGNVTLNAPAGAGALVAVNAGPGWGKNLAFQTAGVNRWVVYSNNTAENPPNNTGSDFSISRYTDAGALVDNPLAITRSSGAVAIGAGGLTVAGPATVSGPNPTITLSGASTVNRMIYMESNGSLRWIMGADAENETGSNAGSNLLIQRFNDSGAMIDNPVVIYRNDGSVRISNPLWTPQANLNAAAGVSKALYFMTGGSPRWVLYSDGSAESGGNAGSTLQLTSYTDAGAGLCNVMSITRAGVVTFNATQPIIHSGPAATNRGMAIYTGATCRWQVLGDATAESGGNAGTNFAIARYNDAGAYLDEPITIQRSTGVVGLNIGAAAPTKGLQDNSTNVATTAYVFNNGIQSGLNTEINSPATLTLGQANAGHLVGLNRTSGTITTVVFPSTGGAGAYGTFLLNNQGGTAIALSFPLGCDYGGTLAAGKQVMVSGDGNGFYRTIATGGSGTLLIAPAQFEADHTLTEADWDDGSLHFTEDATVTIPADFPPRAKVEVSCARGATVTFAYEGVMLAIPGGDEGPHDLVGPAITMIRRRGDEIWLGCC